MGNNDDYDEENYKRLYAKISNYKNRIEELLNYYNKIACPCSFPRFRQIITLNFQKYGHSPFYCEDTEKIIELSSKYYEGKSLGIVNHEHTNEFKCPKCKSIFQTRWEDFSINMSRTYAEFIEINTIDYGAETITKIPSNLWYCGYSNHDDIFLKLDLDEFIAYMMELK